MNIELRDPTVDEAAVFMRVRKSCLYDAKGGERSSARFASASQLQTVLRITTLLSPKGATISNPSLWNIDTVPRYSP